MKLHSNFKNKLSMNKKHIILFYLFVIFIFCTTFSLVLFTNKDNENAFAGDYYWTITLSGVIDGSTGSYCMDTGSNVSASDRYINYGTISMSVTGEYGSWDKGILDIYSPNTSGNANGTISCKTHFGSSALWTQKRDFTSTFSQSAATGFSADGTDASVTHTHEGGASGSYDHTSPYYAYFSPRTYNLSFMRNDGSNNSHQSKETKFGTSAASSGRSPS